MPTWVFEPGHTAAEFCVRHMMVTWVRGHFKDIHGSLEFDPDNPTTLSLAVQIDARKLWTGESQRDQHLRSADFLDVARYPTITFQTSKVERIGATDYAVVGDLVIRGQTRSIGLDLHYLGRWKTPYNEARVTRVGFTGAAKLDRHNFGVSWNSSMDNGGVVVGSDVFITVDVEAILESELRPILEQDRVSS